MAGESTALRETLLQGVDSEVAAVGPRDRLEVGDNDVAGNSPDVLAAPGECNPCGTGGQSKLLPCTGGDDQHICGDVMRCVVLSWSYLLFTWTAVVFAAKVTETHVLFTEDGLTPSGGDAGRDRVDVPVSLPAFENPTREQLFTRARESVGAQDLSCWPGGADTPLDSQGVAL